MANQAVLDEYYAAREAYDNRLESVAVGYATETAEYEAEHQRPTLRAFLVGLKSSEPDRPVFLDPNNYPGRVLSDVEYVGCDDGFHEWQATMHQPATRRRYRAVVRCYPDDSWTVTVAHLLAARDILVSGREWDAVLRHWSDAVLREAKYGA
jgi:hypothetical protein